MGAHDFTTHTKLRGSDVVEGITGKKEIERNETEIVVVKVMVYIKLEAHAMPVKMHELSADEPQLT